MEVNSFQALLGLSHRKKIEAPCVGGLQKLHFFKNLKKLKTKIPYLCLI